MDLSYLPRFATTGYFNMYTIPFLKRVKVTMTCSVESPFWFRVGGVENYPVVVGKLQLPDHARLRVARYNSSVGLGALIDIAVVAGSAGLVSQVSMFVQSALPYQEGCVQATVDGRKLWLSSGLEDYFLGSYFHTMPNMELGLAGFRLDNSSHISRGPNTLAAYRIHSPDPIFFSKSLQLQWQVTAMQPQVVKAGYKTSCNNQWPQSEGVTPIPGADGDVKYGTATVITYAWVYTY